MKKRTKWWIVICVVAAVLIGAWIWLQNTYVLLDGQLLRRDAEEVVFTGEELPARKLLQKLRNPKVLDLRQMDAEAADFDALRQLFPQAEILWLVPLDEDRVAPDAKEIRLSTLEQKHLDLLSYMNNPQVIAIERCGNYDLLLELKNRYPEAEIRYNLLIGGDIVPMDAVQLTIQDPDPEQVKALAYLPELKQVALLGTLPEKDQIYEWMCTYPQVVFEWKLDLFGNNVFTTDTDLILSGNAVRMEELTDQVKYFYKLKSIQLESCDDYAALLQLRQQLRQVLFSYEVPVGGKKVSNDVQTLTLQDADLKALEEALPHLTQLTQVQFTGTVPDYEEIYRLMGRYPQILFQWDLKVCGIKANTLDTKLVLSGVRMESTQQVEESLKYFPNLERVEMCNCGIPSAQMELLTQKFPKIRFVWTIKVGDGTIRTDIKAFIPFKLGYDIKNPLRDEDCTELKYCVDLICLDMGHMRMRDISFLQYMPKMQYLVLGDTPVRDFSPLQYLTELVYLEIFNTRFVEHELLLGMTKLEDLNIGYTPANEVEALKQMTWLERLWVPGTTMSRATYNDLVKALPNTQVVRYVEHSTAGGWRNNDNYRAMRDLLGMFYME